MHGAVRSTEFELASSPSYLLPSNRWGEGSAAMSSSRLFLLSLFLFFLLLSKPREMPSLDIKAEGV